MTEIELRILDNQLAIINALKAIASDNDVEVLNVCAEYTADLLERHFFTIDDNWELPS